MNVDVKQQQWARVGREYGPLLLMAVLLTWLVGKIVVLAGGSDVLASTGIDYAFESRNLDRPFDIASGGDHVPGYPMAIWLIETASFGLLSTWPAMQVIAFATLVGTTILHFTILTAATPIYFLLIAALLFHRANKRWSFIAVVTVAFLAHKASWFFLAWQTWRRDRNAAETWVALAPAVLSFAMSWRAIVVAVRFSSLLVFLPADYGEKRPRQLPSWLRAGALFASWSLSLGLVYYAWFFFFE